MTSHQDPNEDDAYLPLPAHIETSMESLSMGQTNYCPTISHLPFTPNVIEHRSLARYM